MNLIPIPVDISGGLDGPAVQGMTATGASGAGVTLTAPAVAVKFHYITNLRIEAYNVAARVGSATPVIVTTTNIPGNPAYTFGSAGAIGTVETKIEVYPKPIRSSAVNTATTIICPATPNVIWRITVHGWIGE